MFERKCDLILRVHVQDMTETLKNFEEVTIKYGPWAGITSSKLLFSVLFYNDCRSLCIAQYALWYPTELIGARLVERSKAVLPTFFNL